MRDWTKSDQENFIFDYFSIDWDQTLCIDSNDVDKSFKNFLITVQVITKDIKKEDRPCMKSPTPEA